MIKVKKFSKDNYLVWDSFVRNANNGTIFHLRKFLNYHPGERFKDNSIEFYKPIVESLDDYSKVPKSSTKVEIQLEYFNTSSSKCILDLFKKLESIHKAGNQVAINWYYEEDDEDMLEAGEDYEAIIDLPFEMIEVEEI